jgi:hypothetical protein
MGPLLIPERKEFVPEWCPWRMTTEAAWRGDREATEQLAQTKVWDGSPDNVVTCNGIEVTVGMVLPERRYAIERDGRVKEVSAFHRECELKWIETFALAGQKQTGDPSVIPKPHPAEFVQWTEDPRDRRRRIRIGYDPLKPPPPDVKPRTPEEALEDPVAAPAPGFIHKPEGVFAERKSSGETPQERLSMLNQLREGGALSEQEYAAGMRKIAEEAGWASPDSGGFREQETQHDPPPGSSPVSSATSDALFVSETQCGRKFEKGSQRQADMAKGAHERRCRECIGIRKE